MSTNSSSKRCTRRNSRDSNQPKMNISVDLNLPPPLPLPEVGRGSSRAESSRPAGQTSASGVAGSPIDLEASDDELQLLSSPRGFPQVRNPRRRKNRPALVVLDDERETHTVPSGASTDGLVTVSSINRANKSSRTPPNKKIINCENYSLLEESAKKKKTSSPVPEKVISKEPVFNCPICISTLVSPCSTVCGHIFCENCLKSAVAVQKKCPTCRTKLTMKNYFHKVFLPTTAIG